MMKTSKTHQNKLIKFIKLPIRALAKARDFYVRSMNNYADRVCYGSGVSYGDPLPRSFSTTSNRSNDNEDFRDLVRAASTNTLGNRVNLNSVIISSDHNNNNNNSVIRNHSNNKHKSQQSNNGVPRSASVGMAKIEEDKPIEFNDDFSGVSLGFGGNDGGKNAKQIKFWIFPRSRSYAVAGAGAKRNSAVF